MHDTTIDGASVDMKKPRHRMRNAFLVTGALATIICIWGVSRRWSRQDTSLLGPFDAFRATYADKCGTPSYAGSIPKVISDDYLTSQPIRSEVTRQLAALKAGASCQEVSSRLKAVDFAVPPPGSG